MTFTAYGGESDPGAPGGPPGYPIPDEARTQPNYIEGGVPGGGTSGDRRMIIIDRDRWLLFETWATRWNTTGLAVFPGLVRYDEASSGEIPHALRVTVRTTDGYVWPASHEAGDTPGARTVRASSGTPSPLR